MVGRHPVYVARAFRARFGCSIGDYARRRQLALACERLADSELTLPRSPTGRDSTTRAPRVPWHCRIRSPSATPVPTSAVRFAWSRARCTTGAPAAGSVSRN